MRITRQEIATFENVETAEHFMNILRTYKQNQDTEETIIESIEAWSSDTDGILVQDAEAEDIFIEERSYGTVISGTASCRELTFPLIRLTIKSRTIMKF